MRYVFGDWTLDTQLYTLHRAGCSIQLRPKVFQVLTYLVAHRERVVSRQELCEQVWPDQCISEAALESAIRAARQALGDSGRTQQYIQTLHGHGYRFIAPVRCLPAAAAPAESTALHCAPPRFLVDVTLCPETRPHGEATLVPLVPSAAPAGDRVPWGPEAAAPPGPSGNGLPLERSSIPHNLPLQVTSFIGRERASADVKQQLATTRLLTLTGPGGCGKTRLALHVAADVVDAYQDGVWIVELAPLFDPTLVPHTVAAVLGIREEAHQTLLATLTAALRARQILLVLDNCEHLVAACATLADTLLRACAQLRILATSREVLGIAGETVWRVPSLATPAPQCALPLEHVMQYEAVRLFVERATAVLPTFLVTSQQVPWVVQICQRLDGLPLALELAATRIKVLSVEQIARRLEDRFRLLTGGSRTALPRHQTLHATMDWSYDLLAEPERIVWRRLAVFAGGWTLEAAESVCAGAEVEASAILELLASLVDKSVVIGEEQAGQARYRMLETVRQYGVEKLREAGETAVVHQRHRDWYLGLAEQAEPELWGADQSVWLERLETEYDNLRAALAWSMEQEREAEAGLRFGGALWRFWSMRGYWSEGHKWLEAALAGSAGVSPSARAKALKAAGIRATDQSDYASSRAFFEESLGARPRINTSGSSRHGL